MDNIKKNPVLMGVLSCVGCALLLLAIDFVLSLIGGKTFAERLRDPVSLIILIAGPIASGISTFMRTKNMLEGKEKKEQ
uniref:Uncharacterized protein n=1 Tax=uncultured bacterium Contig46 TaxID=1393580 RepID=W0FKY6_9BACT|nr:hypothetical protein [uncultured bacterium Contig46]